MSGFSFNASQLSGRRLVVAVGVWVVVLAAGVACLWWGFRGGGLEEKVSGPTATPTAEGGLVPLSVETPGSQPQPQPGTSAGETTPQEEEVFGYGIQVQGLVGDVDYTMGQVESLGLGWIKQQVRWEEIDRNPDRWWPVYDAVVESANRQGLRVMLSVVDAPEHTRSYRDENFEAGPPDDLSLYTGFLGQLMERYQGRIHAIEVWNEQNLDREWDTAEGVSPTRYVEMLRLAYQTIKSRDPNVIVISGALSPVGYTATDPNNPSRIVFMRDLDYAREMIAQGFLSYCDCVGVHHNGYNVPPDVLWDDATYQDPTATFRGFWDNPDVSWSFRSTLSWYNDAVSGMKPLCVTEFGWASSEGFEGYPPGFEFAQDNTLEEQSQFIIQAYQLMRQWGFVRLAFLFNLDYAQKGGANPADPATPYSILNFNGVARPAFEAVRAMEKP
jgi:hypothetical protein